MLRIPADAWAVVAAHALRCLPEECCGVLAGRREEDGAHAIVLAIPCGNACEGDRTRRFLIDPADQAGAQRAARALGLEIAGFYHSHPDTEACFSPSDLEQAWPWVSYVVLSLRGGVLAEARSYRVDQGRALEEELVLF
jgi:proteasome lid subunit RPN8/RPN11